MLTFTTPRLRDIVRLSNATSERIESIDFHEFSDMEKSVKGDVEWLKKERLILTETVITGWVYEAETGKVRSETGLQGLRKLFVWCLRCVESFEER
jgi:carbonic anhydrase